MVIIRNNVMVINFRGLTKFDIWAPTLYKVDSSNVFLIMQKIILSFAQRYLW